MPRKTFMPPPAAANSWTLPSFRGGFEDQVVVDDVGDAGEGGRAAAAGQFEVALQEPIAEFAADVLVLVVADDSRRRRRRSESPRWRSRFRARYGDAVEKAAAAGAAEFPLLRETCRGGSGEDQESIVEAFSFRISCNLLHDPNIERSGTSALSDDQRDGQAERHRARHRGIDLIESDGAGNEAGVLDIERDAAELDVWVE